VRGERRKSWWAAKQLGRSGGDGPGEREREMVDAGLLGCEAQRAKLNGPAAKKRKVGEGEMKLGLLLRWAERRNRGGRKGKEEREKRVLGFSFLFQNLFLFKPFSNLNIFKKNSKLFKSF
jgi:hypothetical protein